jgi:hypothetical protein
MDWVGLRHNALAISKDEYAGYLTQAAAIRLESNAVVLASSESVRSALDESVEAGASLAKASVLDVVRPGSWPMTAVATLIVRKQRLNCNESGLADFLRWIRSPTAEERVSVADGFVLACTNAKLAHLLSDLLAGFACQTPSLPLEHPDTQALMIIGVVFVGLLLLLVLIRILRLPRRVDGWPLMETDLGTIDFVRAVHQGRYGNVYQARWYESIAPVMAVKSIKCERVPTRIMEAFRAEASYVSSLCHPNLVTTRAVCTSNRERLFIVMDYMPLGSLHDLLHNDGVASLPFPTVLRIAHCAAQGLKFLHYNGMRLVYARAFVVQW